MNVLKGLKENEIEELRKGFYTVLGEGPPDGYVANVVVKKEAEEVKSELLRFAEEEAASTGVKEFIEFLCSPEIINHVKIVIDRSHFNFSALISPRTISDIGGHGWAGKGLDHYDREGYVRRAIALGLDFYVYLKGIEECMEEREMAIMDFW